LKWAAEQLKKKLEEFGLKAVFVATDAPQSEFVELQNHLVNPLFFITNTFHPFPRRDLI
jgi:hypothetical protein